ncbi:syntaxin Ufe1p [Trichomonascus vanleenenianus]|uniref:Ufe1p n=1 Tax=Trichomonascus vanleenenianus TaxID=2268995 RepID=UPI003ECAA195
MDLTHLYLEISRNKLEAVGAQNVKRFTRPSNGPDKLTQECLDMDRTVKNLKAYLLRIRPAYLSNSKRPGHESLTDKQRDEIDYETRMILQQQMNKLRALEALEQERIQRQKQPSALSKYFFDSREDIASKTIELHRAGMFWYLNDLLKEVSDMHALQQEIRLSRQLEKSKNTLHNVRGGGAARAAHAAHNYTTNIAAEESVQAELEQVSPQLLQELESENNALLDELEVSLNKAKTAEKSMFEIAQLQTTLATHLASQNEMIQYLVEDAMKTTQDVGMANKELGSAAVRNRRTSKMIIFGSLIIALILLFNDYML